MPVLLVEKTPYVEAVADFAWLQDATKNTNVRRPLDGIAIKENRWAYVSVQQSPSMGGNSLVPISVKDSSAPGGTSQTNHNFFLQSVVHQRTEKVQIVETFGDHFAFFFGERPTILQIQGLLMNTRDFNWVNEWLHNYENYLRGTRCVETRSKVYLGFDDVLVGGYLTMTQVQYDKEQPYLCPFGFHFLVTDYQDLSGYQDVVTKAEHTRTLTGGEAAAFHTEYLTELAEQAHYEVDDETGIATQVSFSNENAPSSLSSLENQRTAFWVTPKDAITKQWNSVAESMVRVEVDLVAQQQESSTDKHNVRREYVKNPESFALSQRSDSTPNLEKAFGTGISNTAMVLDDAPEVGKSTS